MLTHSEQQPLLHQLLSRYQALPSLKKQAKAWERFLQLGLPTRKHEVFRYVPLRHLFEGTYGVPETTLKVPETFSEHILAECLQSHLVFINGNFQRSLSNVTGLDPQVVICDFREADRNFGVFMNNHWTQSLKEETDPFAAMNVALQPEGIFLYVPPKCIVEKPIQIIHLVIGEQCLALPRIQVVAGKESSLTLVYTTIDNAGSDYAVSGLIDFTLEDNAHVHFLQSTPNLGADSWHFYALRAKLKKHAHFRSIDVTRGARTVRHDYRVTLVGEEADASLNDLWMVNDKREVHANVLIEHQAPNCRSQQLFKGVLADTSRSSFEGKILVQRLAQKTEAYQLNNHLLLSDHASANSKPNLEIFADDVKASHGSTVGQLDAEQLFYLQARGLSEAESKSLLINGFAREIIDLIKVNSLQEELLAQIRGR
jgi:Fe-S cluster assembly protein SufD